VIDFRYHLVSIIAIFFALAAGIVLGAGPLKGTVDQTLTEQTAALRDENQKLHDQVQAAETDAAYQEAFLAEVTPRLIGDQLAGENVAVIAMPGADEDMVTALREALQHSGAAAELIVRIEPSWTDPDAEPTLDTLATELVTSGTELAEDADGYLRGATVLSAALLAQPTGEGAVRETIDTAAVTAFEESGLITVEQDSSTAPTLAITVAGQVSGDDVDERLARLVTLTKELDAASAGVVAAGSPGDAGDGGLLTAIRSDGDAAENVSTVDSAGLPSGRVAVVFAVDEQRAGGVGHYGIVGETDSALPPVPDRPEVDSSDGSTGGSDGGNG
jgi:hypothetical protein